MEHIHTSEKIIRTNTGGINYEYYLRRGRRLRGATVFSWLDGFARKSIVPSLIPEKN